MPKNPNSNLHFCKAGWTALCVWMLSLAGGFSETLILQLRNGDRITGTLISENTNHVILSTTWTKELAIPLVEISKRETIPTAKSAEPPKITETSKPPASTHAPATNAVIALKTNAPPAVIVAPKLKSKLFQAKSWHGKIDVGMDLGFGETSRQLYYGKAKIIYAPVLALNEPRTISSRFKNTFDYLATYGETAGVLSANRMDGVSKMDFDVHKRMFVYNLIALGYDEIRRIDFQYEVGPGVGYHLITRSNFVLNTEFGMNYQVQNFQNNVENERFFLRFAEDFTWTITKKLTLDEKFEVLPSVDELRSFRMRFESNLRYAFWQNISLTFSIVDIYDTKPAAGVPQNDLQIRSMLGLSF